MSIFRSKAIITKILTAKTKEIENGVDGFMVYDSRVVPHVNEVCKIFRYGHQQKTVDNKKKTKS